MALFNKIDAVIVRVNDIKRAKRWYQENLELTPNHEKEEKHKLVAIDVGGSTLLTIYELQSHEVLTDREFSGTNPIFHIKSNIENVHRTLIDRGVEIEDIETDVNFKFFRFRDLDGNLLQVCQY
jgi:catechol 2,3-dioxygenase-like lactoylglutathione lyase family enzyme